MIPLSVTRPVRKFDVAVIGGGTAGVFAAISAARTGARTLLIEKNSILGGTVTVAKVDFPGRKKSFLSLYFSYALHFFSDVAAIDFAPRLMRAAPMFSTFPMRKMIPRLPSRKNI